MTSQRQRELKRLHPPFHPQCTPGSTCRKTRGGCAPWSGHQHQQFRGGFSQPSAASSPSPPSPTHPSPIHLHPHFAVCPVWGKEALCSLPLTCRVLYRAAGPADCNRRPVSRDSEVHAHTSFRQLRAQSSNRPSRANSKHWFTTSFLQPLSYLITP